MEHGWINTKWLCLKLRDATKKCCVLIGIRNIYSNTWVTCGWNCFMNLLGARIGLKENWQDIPINPNYKIRGEFNPGLSVAFPSINRLNIWFCFPKACSLSCGRLALNRFDHNKHQCDIHPTIYYMFMCGIKYGMIIPNYPDSVYSIRRVYPFLGWWWMVYYWLYDIWTLNMYKYVISPGQQKQYHNISHQIGSNQMEVSNPCVVRPTRASIGHG